MANKKSFPPSEKDTKNISLNKLLLNEHFSCDICDIRCLHRTLTGRPSILSKCGRPICFHMNPMCPVSMLCKSEGIQDSDLYSFVLLITFYQGIAKKVNCARNLFGTCLRYFQHMVAIWQREQWCTPACRLLHLFPPFLSSIRTFTQGAGVRISFSSKRRLTSSSI